MNKQYLTRRLARAAKTTNTEAADYLDQAVLSILKQWKYGHQTSWPGLGTFKPDMKLRKPKKTESR